MHVGEAVVHHIPEEDDRVRTRAFGDAPRLAQIHVDEDPGDGPEERAALGVRPLVENLRIGDDEDMSRPAISLTMKRVEVSSMNIQERKGGSKEEQGRVGESARVDAKVKRTPGSGQ